MINIEVKGIPFFLLSTNSSDPIVELLEARFGIKGFAIYVKLLQRIYGDEGYYCLWDSEISDVFASKNGVNATLVSSVVDFLVKRGLFDSDKFDSLGILTSAAIQNHFAKTNSRKKEVRMLENFLCANFQRNVYKNLKIVDKNGKNVYRNETIEKESNGTECNGMECNVTELKNTVVNHMGRELDEEEDRILERMISFYDTKLIIYAFRESAIKGVKSIKYVEGILKNWREQGYTAKNYEEEQ